MERDSKVDKTTATGMKARAASFFTMIRKYVSSLYLHTTLVDGYYHDTNLLVVRHAD